MNTATSSDCTRSEEDKWLLDEVESLEIDWGVGRQASNTELTVFCDDFCSDEVILESSPLSQILRKASSDKRKPSPSPLSEVSVEMVDHRFQKKEFVCPYSGCEKPYAKASHLRAHLRRHTGEKPFNCSWPGCLWKFSRSDELARHIRSHSGLKPYVCSYCLKRFGRSDHLGKHSKVHTRKRGIISQTKESSRFVLEGPSPTIDHCYSTVDNLWCEDIVLEDRPTKFYLHLNAAFTESSHHII